MNFAEKFDEWCRYYDPKKLELKKLLGHINLKGKEVLEIGCGTGRVTFQIIPLVKKLIAIDKDKRMINFCKKKLRKFKFKDKVGFRLMDAQKMNFLENSFDVVLFTWVLHHIPKKLKTVKDVYRILRIGGIVVAIEPSVGEFERISDILVKGHESRRLVKYQKEMGDAFMKVFGNCKTYPFESYYLFPDLEKAIDVFKFSLREFEQLRFGVKERDLLRKILITKKERSGIKVSEAARFFTCKKMVK